MESEKRALAISSYKNAGLILAWYFQSHPRDRNCDRYSHQCNNQLQLQSSRTRHHHLVIISVDDHQLGFYSFFNTPLCHNNNYYISMLPVTVVISSFTALGLNNGRSTVYNCTGNKPGLSWGKGSFFILQGELCIPQGGRRQRRLMKVVHI